jgi:hypothetical protein
MVTNQLLNEKFMDMDIVGKKSSKLASDEVQNSRFVGLFCL